MIATVNPSSHSAPAQYLSIGSASRLLGISREALRAYEKAGRLVSYRTCGATTGHRRYLRSDLLAQCLGVADEQAKGDEGKRVCIYARVSSQGQNKSGSLDRQLERMLTVVAEREGIEPSAIVVYKDICSSFGERPQLNNLVDAIVAGKVASVWVEHQDRLSRVPALTRMIEHLCKKNDVQLTCLDREETQPDEMANAMSELVEFCQVICNRMSSRKQAARRRKVLTVDALEFIRREIQGGRGIKDAVAKANQLGYRTEKNEPVSYRVVQRYLTRIVKKLPPIEDVENSFESFMAKSVKQRKGNKVQAAAIHSAYHVWARQQGITPISARKCGDWLRANGFTVETRCGYVWYDNVEIAGFASVYDAKGEWSRLYDNGIRGERVRYLGRKAPRKEKK